MGKLPATRLKRWSAIYLSEPVGFVSQNWFYNLVAELETALSPFALLFELWRLESLCGRQRTGKITDRTLDLDLLLYEELCLTSRILTLPHPRLHQRRFVLLPLMDLLPQGKHPQTKESFQSLLKRLPPHGERVVFLTYLEP